MLTIGFEVAIEPPDQRARSALGRTLRIGEGIELVNEALGMDPAQAVRADVELPGVVTDDDGVGQEAMRLDAAPQGALGGDHDRIGVDLESRDAESVEMRGPGDLGGEDPLGMFGQAGDHRPGQGALSHVGQRRGIDDIIAVAGAQQLEKVVAVLRIRGAEPSEVFIADLRAEAIRGLVASAGVVHRDPGGAGKPGAQHVAGLVKETVLAGNQQTHELPLGDDDAEGPHQREQPRHRDLPLMVLSEHEAA